MVDNKITYYPKGELKMDDLATYAVATTIIRNIAKELDLVGFLLEHSGNDAGDTALITLCSSMTMVGSRYTTMAEKLSKMEADRSSVLDGQQSIDDALGQGRN